MSGGKFLACALAAAGLAASLIAEATAAPPEIVTLSLEMDSTDARVLFKKDIYDTSSFPAVLLNPKADGPAERLEGRIKVKGSSTVGFAKKGVTLKLASAKWRGSSRVSLNNLGNDTSMMREYLAWDLIHQLGMVAPKVQYARLVINGAAQGLYLWVEWIDAAMFERDGLGRDGQLFHPNDYTFCGDLSPKSVDPDNVCWFKFAPPDGDFGALRTLVSEVEAEPVESFDQYLGRVFDVESLVNLLAVDILVSHTDTYNKNYWLWKSGKAGLWSVVPWDFYLTFGRSFDPFALYPAGRFNDDFQYFYLPEQVGQMNRLRDKFYKNPVLRAKVKRRVKDIIDGTPDAAHPWRGWFAPERMTARINALRDAVRPELEHDPFMAGKQQQFEDEVEALRHYTWARVQYLKRVVLTDDEALPDTTQRVPDVAQVSIAGSGRMPLTDGWGFLLATFEPRAGARSAQLSAESRSGTPWMVPDGVERAACLERTWLLNSASAVAGDLSVDYFDENQLNDDQGPSVKNARDLVLFAHGPDGWRTLPTVSNPLAKTLRATVSLPARQQIALVGCVPPPSHQAAASPATANPAPQAH